ncbi:MAG TPA: DUF4282 domain-containing protein [Epsilonproteobacteria bacterium]|nr:DUF4282 domain-containing protein [Campylobacterota bacterium]
MMEFLSFERFISIKVLILFYYIGAVIMPVGVFIFGKQLLSRFHFFDTAYQRGKEIVWNALTGRQKIKALIALLTCFIFMELFWRMLFEFLIAYMQIRDAMVHAQLKV